MSGQLNLLRTYNAVYQALRTQVPESRAQILIETLY